MAYLLNVFEIIGAFPESIADLLVALLPKPSGAQVHWTVPSCLPLMGKIRLPFCGAWELKRTPVYITIVFPKLFPFRTGDFHCARDGLRGRGDFGAWGRYAMLWHDGSFMRHTRFRCWFLDTWRPGARKVFLRIYRNSADVLLGDLMNPAQRHTLVQQMATTSANIPGSIGERREMRQKLESMVDQSETETAD